MASLQPEEEETQCQFIYVHLFIQRDINDPQQVDPVLVFSLNHHLSEA